MKSFLSFILISVCAISEISGESETVSCDHLGVRLFESVGCKPIKSNPIATCATSYNCSHLEDRDKICWFQGKKLKVGEYSGDTGSCDGSCFCNERSDFTCPAYDCPEYFGGGKQKGCYYTYAFDQCCAAGSKCPPFENVFTCNVDGKEYREGERFSSQDSCMECICQKGFSGKFEEPYCKVPVCSTELRHTKHIQNKCAPIYGNLKARCCPDLWLCPKDSDKFVTFEDNPEEKVCDFGGKKIHAGSVLKTTYEKYGQKYNLDCTCELPPLISCLVTKSEWIH